MRTRNRASAGQAEVYDSYTQKRVEIYAEYETQCNREGVVDFAELLLRCYELLQRNEPLRAHYQQRFRHILVDEFQDTNVLQYAWLKLLAGGGANVFAVGDDDQSIYRFRGAEVGNMREFEREYAGPNVIRLEQNYRSHGNILAAANAIIKNNRERLGKNLWTDAGEGEPIRASRPIPTSTRRASSSRKSANWCATACRRRRLPCSTAPTPSRGSRKRTVHQGRAVQGLWRPALLRAPGNQACAGLPAPAGQSGRRHGLPARGQFPDPRHRRPFAGKPAGHGAPDEFQPVQRGRLADRQGRPDGGRLHPADRSCAGTDGLPLPEMVEHVIENPAWPSITAPRRKARIVWRTWTN
jgi:hypothetical protein